MKWASIGWQWDNFGSCTPARITPPPLKLLLLNFHGRGTEKYFLDCIHCFVIKREGKVSSLWCQGETSCSFLCFFPAAKVTETRNPFSVDWLATLSEEV